MSALAVAPVDYDALVQDDRIHAYVSVFMNRCTYRGTMVCPAARGNARVFSCPYHGWTYDLGGNLLGVSYPGGYDDGFILAELSVQAKHETHLWAGRATHRLRRVNGELRTRSKRVILINAAEPLPNLSFLI